MTAKRAIPRKRPAKVKAKAPAPALTESAVLVILESTGDAAASPPDVDDALRREMVAAEAYFIAERRGFAAGHEMEDWLAAEALVDSRLRETRAA